MILSFECISQFFFLVLNDFIKHGFPSAFSKCITYLVFTRNTLVSGFPVLVANDKYNYIINNSLVWFYHLNVFSNFFRYLKSISEWKVSKPQDRTLTTPKRTLLWDPRKPQGTLGNTKECSQMAIDPMSVNKRVFFSKNYPNTYVFKILAGPWRLNQLWRIAIEVKF